MSGVIQEAYSGIVMGAGATITLQSGVNRIGGFLASVAGTVTITNDKGITLLAAYPLTAGFNKIPLAVGYNTVVALTTAAGTLLVGS